MDDAFYERLWRESGDDHRHSRRAPTTRFDRESTVDATVVRVPKTYPAYFGAYKDFPRVREWLDGFDNLFLVGRNGMHRYNNQDHSMLTAKLAVESILSGKTDKSAIWEINVDDEYHEERSGNPRENTA